MTAHIARTKIPTNASPERTCLNEELVEFPEEVADRTEAISYRLEHAGLTRKIGTNQVRVIRVMLTGSHDAMKRIEEEGRLPEWCADNLAWLRETFGTENVVSAVVHRDESTPHIHAAVVPIVTGERRKARTVPSGNTGQATLPSEIRRTAPPLRRRRHVARPAQAVSGHLCRSDVQIRAGARHRRFGGAPHHHARVLPADHRPAAGSAGEHRRAAPSRRAEAEGCRAAQTTGAAGAHRIRTDRHAPGAEERRIEPHRGRAEEREGRAEGSQVKNAAAEVGSNIVEGSGR